jgi:hypothetical protein
MPNDPRVGGVVLTKIPPEDKVWFPLLVRAPCSPGPVRAPQYSSFGRGRTPPTKAIPVPEAKLGALVRHPWSIFSLPDGVLSQACHNRHHQ